MKTAIVLLTILTSTPLLSQERTLSCDESRGNWDDSGRQRLCEMREYPSAAVSRLSVDGRTNGGVNIKGWDRSDILVRAQVTVWAPSLDDARALSKQVSVQTAGGNVRADAPDFGSERGWAVSYEIFVPHRIDLSLKAHNGGIKMSDVTGSLDFEATNGGVALLRLAGNVRGKTTNGGLKVELTGNRWEGGELDVRATNGGVSLEIPDNYSARLETGTVNGRLSVHYPVTLQGRIDTRQLNVSLGAGGPLVRVMTTNGGVSVRRKS